MNKIFIAFVFGIFLLGIVSAEACGVVPGSPFKLNSENQITNYCADGGCTFMNVTDIKSPDGVLTTLNVEMDKTSQNFNYTYTPTQLGTYTVHYLADPLGYVVSDCDTFEVTNNGETSSVSSSIIGTIILIILIILFGILIFFSVNLDGTNYQNDRGEWMGINLKKYAKIFLIGLILPIFIVILSLMLSLANTMGGMNQFSVIIGTINAISIGFIWPWTILILIFFVYQAWKDTQIKKWIKENFEFEQ